MPPSDKPITDPANPVATDPTAVNAPAPASAPGAVSEPTMTPPIPGADALKVEETVVPEAAPAADVPTVGQTTDLPKPPEEGTNTGNQGGVPPATTGM